MTRPETASVGSTLSRMWSRWCSWVEWSWSLVGNLAARCRGRSAGLNPATCRRVIDLIEGDLDCLIEDVSRKPVAAEQSAEELLLNRDVLVWLRGGPLPGQGAVELLEENVAVFYQAPAADELANGKALRAALDDLVRAQGAAAQADGRCERTVEAAGYTERERWRFGLRLDELRQAKNMTIGDLAARSGIDVVSIVAFIYGAQEAGSSEMMSLAAALEAEPRELFPEFLAGSENAQQGDDR